MTTLFDFTGDKPSRAWPSINDDVMGGLSEGSAILNKEGMDFYGNLSLKNNGGFSSIHCNGHYKLQGHDGIRFRVKGDGRTYQLRMQTNARLGVSGKVAFSKGFSTSADQWKEVFISFSELNQSWRGRQLSGYEFDPSKIESIGFLLSHKQEGPFRMTISWIIADNR